MVPRYDVSEGADGLLRVGTGAHTHLKLTREDASWLCTVLAERLGLPPPKLPRLPWWRRALDWFSRKARAEREAQRDAMYARIAQRAAKQYGMRE